MAYESLVERLRNPRGYDECMDAMKDAADALERIGPFAQLTLDAIEADRADCILVRGEIPDRRYVTLHDAVTALQRTLLK